MYIICFNLCSQYLSQLPLLLSDILMGHLPKRYTVFGTNHPQITGMSTIVH